MKGGVRERSKGKWSYYFKYKDEFEKWKTKEKSGFKNKKEAESALRKAITEFEEDGFMTTKTTYTLEEYIEYWFEDVAKHKLKYNSYINYQSAAKKHIYPELGHLNLTKLTPIVVQKYISKKHPTCNTSTMAHIKKVLNGAFDLAVKQRILKENPLRYVGKLSKKVDTQKETSFLSKDQIDLILTTTSSNKYYLPILIAIHTGMRRGEVLGLTWDDVDLENRIITINKQLLYQKKELVLATPKTKTSNRQFVIPMHLIGELLSAKETQEANMAYYDEHYHLDNNFVCCEEDGSPFKPYDLTTYISTLSSSLNLPFRFHDLRHTHASLLLEADVNIKVIQERLGHSNITTTLNVYSHISKKLEFSSIEKFDELFATKNTVSVAERMAK